MITKLNVAAIYVLDMRRASVTFVRALEDSDLLRAGMHPRVGRVQVIELLHEWVYHDLNHVRQVTANVQALLWPQLGNLQQFYQQLKR